MDEEEIRMKLKCGGCKDMVLEPYIVCVDCRPAQVQLCLQCFSKGVEFGSHQSDHAYTILRNDFTLFENNWTASEETVLLETLSDCGYGNWSDAAQRLRTKNKEECKRHYNTSYINGPIPDLPQFRDWNQHVYPQPLVYKLCDDPPRFPDTSVVQQEMGGYMAARGDFNIEYDNFQELEIQSISFDEEEETDELEERLKLAVMDVYLHCLKQRGKRKMIVRKYGLINLSKVQASNRLYVHNITDLVDKLRVFVPLQSPIEYDKFIKGIHVEKELRLQIRRLQECRQNGIIRMRNTNIYKTLKKRRQATKAQTNLLSEILVHMNDNKACQTWLQRQVVLNTISKGVAAPLPMIPRRSAPPLDIIGLPGYDKLTDSEREMCAGIRLVPDAYLEFRAVMTAECAKAGSLKLSQARNMIKIDVNKTRRIYDFLLSEGHINKDPL
ncbi:transcriptional adapter 2-alpha-like isoform X1 [Pecten maximus]|uniref:transcriptional adapter 2-alpha-like isoform X1 n=1 Tax=Pecten maximus TaxID=6579 RepID=UPI0014586418|nr:transcriptional adapter 2-alpha-like isoform X1 [Pecten maximus]